MPEIHAAVARAENVPVPDIAAPDSSRTEKAGLRAELERLSQRLNGSSASDRVGEAKSEETRLQPAGVLPLEHDELLRVILDQMPAGVSIAEAPSGRLLFRNKEGIRLLGHSPLSSSDAPWYIYYGWTHADGQPFSRSEYPVARAFSGEPVIQEEMCYMRPNGVRVDLVLNATPVRNQRGEIVRVVSTFHEVPHRKHAEEALRAAREELMAAVQLKSVFLANMSHEIRTPLTSILGCANLLTRTLEGKPLSYAERIERSGKRLTRTLNAVLTLARLESHHVELHLEPLDLAAEVSAIVESFRPEADRKALSLVLEVSPGARAAQAMLDSAALNTILQNLLGNAIKFTEQGGVTIRVDVDDSDTASPASEDHDVSDPQVRIQVTDTGVGISEEFMAHLFHPFTQESTGLERSFEGNGLGLCIAHQFTEHMHGSLRAESAKGQGSCFTVSFPRCG